MSENLPRSSKSRKRRTASLKFNPPLDLKPQIVAARDLIKSLNINSPNGLKEVHAVIKFCNSALKNRQNNRGGVITRLLSAAKAKQTEFEPILRGERIKRLPHELLANIFEFATADGLGRRTAYVISHVNQMWRALALRLPHLWAHIFLSKHTQYIPQMLPCILDRSKNVSLKVSISGNEGLSHLHSLRPRIVWFESVLGWFRGDVKDLDLPDVEYVSMQGSIFLRLGDVPKLRHLRIGSWHTLNTVFRTGSTYEALRTLKCPLGKGRDVQALSACPNLRCAFFELSFANQEGEMPKVTLLFLELLAMSGDGVPDPERLLARADLPRLKHLTLYVRGYVRFGAFDGSPTFLPQLETLRVEYEIPQRLASERISHLLTRTPNLRKLTITRLYLIYELPDMTARFNSNPVSKDESVPQEVANDPFLPRLHTLVLLDCFKLPLLSTELKKLMFQWAASHHSDGDGSAQLAFRTNCVEQRCLTRLKNSWPGVVASPTQGDLINVNGEHWLMDELIE